MALEGKRIVVLGGTSGIGLATAQAAVQAGAQLVIVSRNPARVEEARKQVKGAEGHALDLADAKAVERFFATLGAFDHLVFTAGETLQLDTLAKTDLAAARQFFDLRFWGAYQAAKFGAGQIRVGGSITFTSGIASQRPRAGWALGASICAAMEGLTRALAVELAPVRVNIVAPGVVKTPLWSNMATTDRDALYRSQAEQLPVGHVGEAEEIAKAYLYLMNQSYGTGQVLTVDGGAVLV
ncbi:MAG TPA: SDR family oxidoreductase [Magnetospirillaceae bacterium]|jgi:NAD(P)-dependent dehydrogenase (short-subunit alcohol dehydrogenase family)